VAERSAHRAEIAAGGAESLEGRPRSVSDQAVRGATDARGAAVQDMSVDHRREVFAAQQLLEGPDVASAFKEMGGEEVAKSMTGGLFRSPRIEDGSSHGRLEDGLVQVVPPELSPVDLAARGGKHQLPGPLPASRR